MSRKYVWFVVAVLLVLLAINRCLEHKDAPSICADDPCRPSVPTMNDGRRLRARRRRRGSVQEQVEQIEGRNHTHAVDKRGAHCAVGPTTYHGATISRLA
jgi:hypothetical protein